MTARGIGEFWEDAALAFAQKAGLKLVARNFHCRYGEIDLVLLDGETLVFTEVRYRHDAAHGDGTASVGPTKQRKLVQTAQIFLQNHPRFAGLPCRFDVIGCSGTPQRAAFEWTRHAFDAI